MSSSIPYDHDANKNIDNNQDDNDDKILNDGCDINNQVVNDLSRIRLSDIPWDDIIFPKILKYCSWGDLFRMRRLAKWSLNMINQYFKTLTVVDLGPVSRRFTAQAFHCLTVNCTNLRVLNLGNCKWITNEVLIPVIENNPKLIVFDISSCYQLTNACLERLASCCLSLKHLSLKECHWVEAAAIFQIAFHCNQLEEVDLTSCWEVTDDAMIELAARCPNLKRLSLSRIYGITDRTLLALGSYTTQLEFLNVSGCWRITDLGITYV